jgi:hypothetical protein
MNDQTQKADAGKSNPLLLQEDMAEALEAVNAPLDYGVEKYGYRGGWKRVGIERYQAAAERHRKDRMKYGTASLDDESDLLHLTHEICNLMFLLQTHLEQLSPAQRRKVLTYKKPVPVNG